MDGKTSALHTPVLFLTEFWPPPKKKQQQQQRKTTTTTGTGEVGLDPRQYGIVFASNRICACRLREGGEHRRGGGDDCVQLFMRMPIRSNAKEAHFPLPLTNSTPLFPISGSPFFLRLYPLSSLPGDPGATLSCTGCSKKKTNIMYTIMVYVYTMRTREDIRLIKCDVYPCFIHSEILGQLLAIHGVS